MNDVLTTIDSFVWGPFLLIPLLLGTGIYLTIRLRGLQIRKLGYALWMALVKRKESDADGDISHYQALSLALAATVGVGNIAGVGTAIHLGGPGALFWIWVTGLVGMATKYSEAFLGVRFRTTNRRGEQTGGPMYYLSRGINNRFGSVLAVSFAVFGVLASFGIGNMTQANSVAEAINGQWGIAHWITGLIITVLAGLVIIGGVKRLGAVASAFVPVMIVFYVLGSCVVLALNVSELPAAFALIFTDAFTGTAAAGGFAGAGILLAIQYGVARGIFSNESGLGTGGIAAAAAQTSQPVRQALVSMTQTFIDTLVVVSFTGLVIVVTGTWRLIDPNADTPGGGFTGAAPTREAFAADLGTAGGLIVAIGIMFFAFSTLLGWSYYGERCIERLFGTSTVQAYRLVFVVIIFVGSVTELELVWNFSDIMNGLMALPNLIGLIILSPLIVRETRAFFAQPDWKVMADVGNGTTRS
ncbi:sodium:alanine symporter family protein [Pseudonocardia eucalypti]|uniref:Sodium:alanine symporter family protein n=1 Tax=Pseudonocardia eucalypti TaxID=648755 RepID=A0ABP9Q386_9PSEU|nr:AGCS family alanine or glycine:cation symporter [Pseudonocardia eucalypti]